VGKTRLATRLGAEVGHAFPDGVWLIDVAPLADAKQVPQTVADILGVHQRARKSWSQTLANELRDRRLLLLLDTCEHLLPACAELASGLLRLCPDVHILATTRQPLGLEEEEVWRVAPLSVPDALQLFVARARAVMSDFVLTEANANVVAHICQHLDGLPLGLELVAARVAGLGLSEIFTRMDASYALQISGRRGAPQRQLTLRATQDWSYALLSEPERLLLRRLAVFVGGWTLDSARGVATDALLPAASMVDLLESLVSKSLVLVDKAETKPRYRLLNITRQYLRDELDANGELERMSRRHVDWWLAVAERAPPEALDIIQADRLEQDQDNMRGALRWTVDHDEARSGLRLAVAAFPFWLYRGHYAEARTWLDRLLALEGASNAPSERNMARGFRSHLLLMQGEVLAAEAELQDVIADQRTQARTPAVAVSLVMLGNVALWRGDLPTARERYAEALDALAGFDSHAEHIALYQLAILACELQEFDEARALAVMVADAGRVRARPAAGSRASYLQGLIAAAEGDRSSASVLFSQVLDQQRTMGDQIGVADSLVSLGRLRLDEGRRGDAAASFEEAISLAHRMGDRLRVLRAQESLAGAIARTQPDAAVRLASAVARVRADVGAAAWPRAQEFLQTALAAARSRLGRRGYSQAWEAGQLLPESSNLNLALSSQVTEAETPPSGQAPTTSLTRREREVLQLFAGGSSTREIAERLVISPATVRTHLDRTIARLGLHSRVELATWAAVAGDHLEA
jgi:predicted ATPase/DNA-binding CsgD family transcriptional regulator